MDNIILIGMPASGKSTVGVILAKILGYDFVDTDLLIQKRERMKLEEIIETRGLEGFLGTEGEVCAAIEADRTVIATGGSAVYSSEAMEHLKELGTVIYLRVDRAELEHRIGDMRHRGVAIQDGQTFADMYRERSALYERWADVTVDEGSMTLEDTAAAAVLAMRRG